MGTASQQSTLKTTLGQELYVLESSAITRPKIKYHPDMIGHPHCSVSVLGQLGYWDMYAEQKRMADYIEDHDRSFCVFGLGLGKTVSVLTAVQQMGFFSAVKVLVVAPKSVAVNVWPREIKKWSHLDLNYSLAVGKTPINRTRALIRDLAIHPTKSYLKPHIHIINRDNVTSMVNGMREHDLLPRYRIEGKPFRGEDGKMKANNRVIETLPYDMIVIDESTSFKNSDSLRWKALSDLIQYCKKVVLMTGTPISNGLEDLWGQIYMLDGGSRLGRSKYVFEQEYFTSDPYKKYIKSPKHGSEEKINDKLADITFTSDFKATTDIPEVVYNDEIITLPVKIMETYQHFEMKLILELKDGTITAFNAGTATAKLEQIANGSAYESYEDPSEIPSVGKVWHHVHDAKMEAMEEALEEATGASDSVVIVYKFIADRERIFERLTGKRWFGKNRNSVGGFGKGIGKFKGLNVGGLDIGKWEAKGEDKLNVMLIHPKCLHEDTEVLTEHRGWVKIVNINSHERVYDGVEFVSHDGCRYSGHKAVTEVFGITMTPDHKILIDGEWIEAKDVKTDQDTRRKAIFKGDTPHSSAGTMHEMQSNSRNAETEFHQAQSKTVSTMQSMQRREQHQVLWHLEGDSVSHRRSVGQKLRRPWHTCMQAVAHLREFLSGYVSNLSRRLNDRKGRRGQGLLEKELLLDFCFETASQQAQQPLCYVPGGADTPSRTDKNDGYHQRDADVQVKQGNDGRSNGARCDELKLSKTKQEAPNLSWFAYHDPVIGTARRFLQQCIAIPEQRHNREAYQKADVYDLVNCGPRHRFLVRNDEGETYISSNSCGHGINLQFGGHIMFWFGLCWSLELWLQTCGRLPRLGQEHPVVIKRFLCENTIDIDQRDRVEGKNVSQQDLLKLMLDKFNLNRVS